MVCVWWAFNCYHEMKEAGVGGEWNWDKRSNEARILGEPREQNGVDVRHTWLNNKCNKQEIWSEVWRGMGRSLCWNRQGSQMSYRGNKKKYLWIKIGGKRWNKSTALCHVIDFVDFCQQKSRMFLVFSSYLILSCHLVHHLIFKWPNPQACLYLKLAGCLRRKQI